MKTFRHSVLAVALACASAYAPAKEVTGFLTGSSEGLGTGVYQHTLEGPGVLTILKTYPYALFGGAYGDHVYWLMMGNDIAGNVMDGLWAVDPSTGEMYRKVTQEYGCTDMTFDYSSNDLYGILCHKAGNKVAHELVRIETYKGSYTRVAVLDNKYQALACDLWGNMYAMSAGGSLYKIDTQTGQSEFIGNTGIQASTEEVQSMEFDRDSGKLYWSFLDSDENAYIATVDTGTGRVVEKLATDQNALLGALYIPFKEVGSESPNTVTDLKTSVGSDYVSFTWTAPAIAVDGSELTSPMQVEIRRDGEVVATFDGVKPGAAGEWTDTSAPVSRDLRYAFTCYQDELRGMTRFEGVHIGPDVPASVSDVEIVSAGDGATLSWTAPATDRNGMELDRDALTYRIVRTPATKEWTGIKECSFTDNEIPEANKYSYTISAINQHGESKSVQSESVIAGPAITMPWYPDFREDSVFSQFIAFDLNDSNTWQRNGTELIFNSIYFEGNDWLVSVPLHLEQGVEYKIAYKVGTGYNGFGSTENFKLTLGTDCSPETQNRVIRDLKDFNNPGQEFEDIITVDESGDYTIGLYAYSNHVWDRWQIKFSGLSIEPIGAIDLTAGALEGPAELNVGTEAEYTVSISNRGTETQTGFDVSLVDDSGNMLATTHSDATVAPGASTDITIGWTPMNSNVKSLRAYVSKEGDVNNVNNYGPELPVRFLIPGQAIVNVGTPDSEPGLFPFNFEDLYSLCQSIYEASEIDITGGMIKEISWKYNNPGAPLNDKDIRVYMGNTNKPYDAGGGFTPVENLMLVYEGKASFMSGENTLSLKLTRPFPYAGENLIVSTTKLKDVETGKRVTFKAQNFPEMPRTLIAYNSSGKFNPTEGLVSSMLPCISLVLDTEGGGRLEGRVTCGGNPAFDAEVSIGGLATTSCVDGLGRYAFNWLPAGKYMLDVKAGHYSQLDTHKEFSLGDGDRLNINLELDARPSASLSGIITDKDGNPVENAAVIFNGWESQTATTDSEGKYTFPPLYQNEDVSVNIYACGYRSASHHGEYTASEASVMNFALEETEKKIAVAEASLQNETAQISWTPLDFGYDMATDNGTASGNYSLGNQNTYMLGKRFDGPVYLTTVMWHTPMSFLLQPEPVDIYIYGINQLGIPDRILYSATGVANTANSWNEHRLTEPIEANNGVLIALTSENNFSISHDGTETEGSYLIDALNGTYGPLTEGNKAVNLMIRTHAAHFNPTTGYEAPAVQYNVYRLDAEAEQMPEKHEQIASGLDGTDCRIADTDWSKLAEGMYKYGVEASYAGNKVSERTFSNALQRVIVGIDGVEAAGINLYTERGGILHMEIDKPYEIQIFSVDGKCIYSDSPEAGTHIIQLTPGIYVVHAGSYTAKINLQ